MKRFFKTIIMVFIIMQIMTLTAFAYEKVQKLEDMEDSIYKHLENRDANFTFLYTGTRKEFEDNIRKCIKDAYSKDDYLERSWLEIKPKANSNRKWNRNNYRCNLFNYKGTRRIYRN